MHKRLTMILAIGASFAVAAAGIAFAKGEGPFVVILGNLKVTGNGTFSPKTLPRNRLAPITLKVSGKIETLDGKHPPAAKEIIIETDKNGSVNAKGLPVCTSGKLQAQDTKHAEAACKSSIIGEGTTDVEVEFPEQPPFIAKSKLLAFNGGVSGSTTTIFVHAFLTAPVSAAVVTTVKVSKIHNGRYGLKSIATIPKIAGGYGSPVSFSLKVGRSFAYGGEQQNYLLAKCPDGHLNARGTGIFSDGSHLTGHLVRSCTPKG